LIDIGKSIVAVGESVLDTLKSAEVVSVTTVLRVPMLLAPCLVEDRQSTVVLCSDSIDKSQCVWQCLVVHHLLWKAWSLTLVLQDNNIPVPIVDMPQAVGGMPLKMNPPRSLAIIVDTVPCSCGQTRHHVTERTGVAVTKEQDLLVLLAELLLARVGESNTLVRTGTFFRVFLYGWAVSAAIRKMIGAK